MTKILLTLLFVFTSINAINLNEHKYTIEKVTDNEAIIHKGKLTVGQSGIIVHNFSKNKSIIITKAIVKSSSENSSILEFVQSDILKQDSVVNTNLNPKNGDDFILNNLYKVSLLITPNYDAYKGISRSYSNNFIDSELFAAYLKINNLPVPNMEDFQDFMSKNNIGTLYIVINKKLYILDSFTFKILHTRDLKLSNNKTSVPFFTNIKDIKISAFNWFGQEKIEDYNKYYSKLIGINHDRK